jgi:hypothetical protein
MTAKRFVFSAVLWVVMILIIGCASSAPEADKSTKTDKTTLETQKTEPKTESAKIEVAKTEIAAAEPNKIEQPKAEAAKIVTAIPEAPKAEQPKPEPQKPEEAKAVSRAAEAEKTGQPKREPQKPEPLKATAIDSFNKACAVILNPAFVNDKGMVDYKALKRKRQELQAVLNEFASFDPNEYKLWPKEDKIAFWLNVYNIELLKIIVDNYPIKTTRIHLVFWPPTSIRHIRGIWSDYKFIVMGEQFTLSEIDKRFFRKEFGDPLVFMGVSQASLSSPPLRNRPYRGSKLYKQLDEQARRFLPSPSALEIDAENQVVYLSALFQSSWYGNEFINKYGTDKKFKDQPAEVRAVLNFVSEYVPKEIVSYLEVKNYTVKYIIYDWRLNE